MKKIRNKELLLFYSVILIIVFYLLPSLFKGGIASLFIINPLIVLFCSIICGKNHKNCIFISIITALLFLPSIFIFYNESAWIYIMPYTIISLVGGLVGLMRYKDK